MEVGDENESRLLWLAVKYSQLKHTICEYVPTIHSMKKSQDLEKTLENVAKGYVRKI